MLLEPELERLTDAELRARTDAFRKRLADGESLDDLLVEAFATVREAAKRTLGQRHFDVQLIGGMVLHNGKIAEMKTGEGKTLVATLPVYLNALAGKGVHVVTVNDYLAQRDAEWMGRIYKFLGLTVGVIVHELDDDERRAQYACDVTYGTNNELGFDYLRDNMKMSAPEMVQRGHFYAIVDEVELDPDRRGAHPAHHLRPDRGPRRPLPGGRRADEGPGGRGRQPIEQELVKTHGKEQLKELLKTQGLIELDEKQRQASFTEAGNERLEELLREKDLLKGDSLYDIENVTVVHHANQALKAHKLFQRDRDYIVKGGEVVIIDEFTGRMMQGRRYSEGLHQALEAKEHVEIQPENQTLASITFQNYFRLYSKLVGHDRHGRHRGQRVHGHLQARRAGDPDQPVRRPQRRARRGLPHRQGEEPRHRRRDRRLPPPRPADPGRHRVDREVGALSGLLKDRKYIRELGHYMKKQADGLKPGKEDELKAQLNEIGDLPRRPRPQEQRRSDPPPGAQRPLPRAGGDDHRPGRHARRRDDRHQHGRPRHRHPARRQRQVPRPRLAQGRDRGWPHERRPRRGRQSRGAAAMGRRCPHGGRRVDRCQAQGVGRGQIAEWTKEQIRQGSRADAQGGRQEAGGHRGRAPPGGGEAGRARQGACQGPGRPAQRSRDGDAFEGWSDQRLREEARQWQRGSNGEAHLGAVSETLFRFMSGHLSAWADREESLGRKPGPEELAAKRTAIVKAFNEVAAKCAEIQADVAEKKQKAIDAGGLYVLGTERHESRRIDNQLRGRSGRQGDPGRSKFYLSLEDDLMRIFGSDRMDGVLQKLGLQEGEAITHPWINKALEKAQQKVEARNFDARKYVLKYDDVMNDQRKVIFEQRIDIMGHDDVSETVAELRHQVVQELVAQCIPPNAYAEQWDTEDAQGRDRSASSASTCRSTIGPPRRASPTRRSPSGSPRRSTRRRRPRRPSSGPETMRQIEKMVLLQTLDHLWREHLVTLEHLRQVIGFRSYGQRDPLNEYKSEGFHLFETMLANLREAVTGTAYAHPGRAGRGGAGPAAGRAAADAGPPRRSLHRRGRAGHGGRGAGGREPARGARRRAACAPADAAGRGRRGQPQGPRHLGQGRPQRGLSLRLGQEIQALPRQARLRRGRPVRVAIVR